MTDKPVLEEEDKAMAFEFEGLKVMLGKKDGDMIYVVIMER